MRNDKDTERHKQEQPERIEQRELTAEDWQDIADALAEEQYEVDD